MNNNLVEKNKPPYNALTVGVVPNRKTKIFPDLVTPKNVVPHRIDSRTLLINRLRATNSAHFQNFEKLKIDSETKGALVQKAHTMFSSLLDYLPDGDVPGLRMYVEEGTSYLYAKNYSYYTKRNLTELLLSTAILAIEEVIEYCESSLGFANPYGGGVLIYLSIDEHKKETFSRLWEIIKKLDRCTVSYEFNRDVYQPRRIKIRSKILAAGVEVRTKQEIQREELHGCLGDIGNCLGELVIAFVFMLFIALLVTMCTS